MTELLDLQSPSRDCRTLFTLTRFAEGAFRSCPDARLLMTEGSVDDDMVHLLPCTQGDEKENEEQQQ